MVLDESVRRKTSPHVANHAPRNEVVATVNRKLRGWSQHFSVGTLEPAYRTADRYTEALFRQFLVRRHKIPGRGTRPFSNRYLYEELGLLGGWPADVAPACLDVKPVREPDAGKPHVRFDERVRETESWTPRGNGEPTARPDLPPRRSGSTLLTSRVCAHAPADKEE